MSAGAIKTAVIILDSGMRVEFCNARALTLFSSGNAAQLSEVLFAPGHEFESELEKARGEPRECVIKLDHLRAHLQITGDERGWVVLAHDLDWFHAVRQCMRSASEMRVRERTSGALVHSVKSPMHAMGLALDILRKTLPAGERPRHYIETIGKELARLNGSLQGLLAKPQSDAEEHEFDLHALISEVAAMVRIEAALREVRFKHLTAEAVDGVAMLGRRQQIKHALASILLNVLDSSSEGAEVELKLTREGAWARVTITGAKPPPQSASSYMDVEVAREIAGAHGGEFYAESSRRVCFKLPLTP